MAVAIASARRDAGRGPADGASPAPAEDGTMVRKLFHRVEKRVATAPGTLVFTGRQRLERVGISVLDYDPESQEERRLERVEDAFPYRDSDPTSWINVDGLHDTEALGALGAHFGLHPLVMEDIVNTRQRPKLEDYGQYVYLVCRMISFNEETSHIETEQVSIVLMPHVVLSFQEHPGDVFEPVRERIRIGRGRIRGGGASYLAYALMDAVVDHYFVVLEKLSDRIETLEEELLESPTQEQLETIHELKREMILLRRSVWPLREVLAALQRTDSPLVGEETVVFLRDVYDHTVQVVEVVESFRDILSGLQDLYLTSISNRMNEIMKVLTIIATIFIPLTFLAGIYGMNFERMPELGWKWSYAVFWVVILALGGVMVAFFRRRKWL
jgi:magnesium transporter